MKTDSVLLHDLIEATKNELAVQKYSAGVIHYTEVTFQQLSDYAKEKNELYYSTDLTKSFLSDRYGHPIKDNQTPAYKWETVRRKITDLKKLEWMFECSHINKNTLKSENLFLQNG